MMILIKRKPNTNGLRDRYDLKSEEITYRGRPFKPLTHGINRSYGIDNKGHKSVRGKVRGNKKLYRDIQFKRPLDILGTIVRCEYNPNSNALIDLIKYADGSYGYILHTLHNKPGDQLIRSEKTLIKPGNSIQLFNVPNGQAIHSIELNENEGAKLIRSAGGYATVLSQEGKFTKILLPSKEIRLINRQCWCVIGQIGNIDARHRKLGKAGLAIKLLGKGPKVRGTAMCAAAHPHGGGEGRTPIGRKFILDKHGNVKGKISRSFRKFTNRFIITNRRKNRA